ncbi:MAG TPA: PEP-CTERM sorting domain-containing protein [Casimicrobiaceae bacterium]|nr:PEP-CTERM sorting domain-containing protein [Casimicrobiaceae bacterium]
MPNSIIKRVAACSCACLAFAFGRAAIAGDLHTIGYANGAQQFSLSMGGSPGAGGFYGTWNGDPIVFWCVELDQYFGFGNTYTYSASLPDSPVFTLLGELFHEAYGSALTDSTHSAAFQLAVWEIFFDSGSLNLSSGNFRVVNDDGHTDAVTIAQGWLNGLSNSVDDVDVFYLVNDGHQNFITNTNIKLPRTQTVPEPSTLWLMLAAAMTLAALARRRGRG